MMSVLLDEGIRASAGVAIEYNIPPTNRAPQATSSPYITREGYDRLWQEQKVIWRPFY